MTVGDANETAKRLSKALNDSGMRAIDLANASGVSKASISHYLQGRNVPNNISAGKMAKVLNVNPAWIMGFDVPMNAEDDEYYIDADARELAEFLHKNPDYRVLLDASRKLTSDDVKLQDDGKKYKDRMNERIKSVKMLDIC